MLFKNAPIIIPTINRYEHLKRCVESLANNPLAKESELVISLDYPPHEKYRDGWEKIKEYLPTIAGFGKVTVLYADENIGAAKNCNKLREYVKGLGYDAFILTEDDNIFAPNFLDYINWGLRTFKDDKSILAVCGFKRVNTSFLNNNVYTWPHQFVAWGYGMWFDRREKIEELESFEVLKKYLDTCPISIIFTEQVYIAVNVLSILKHRKILGDSLPFLLPKEERYCLYPKISKVRNQGFDGTGLHCVDDEESRIIQDSNPLDEDEEFTPIIKTPLYESSLKQAYRKTYPDSIARHIRASLQFLIYRLTGKMWRIS